MNASNLTPRSLRKVLKRMEQQHPIIHKHHNQMGASNIAGLTNNEFRIPPYTSTKYLNECDIADSDSAVMSSVFAVNHITEASEAQNHCSTDSNDNDPTPEESARIQVYLHKKANREGNYRYKLQFAQRTNQALHGPMPPTTVNGPRAAPPKPFHHKTLSEKAQLSYFAQKKQQKNKCTLTQQCQEGSQQ